MEEPFEIYPYSIDNLIALLSNKSISNSEFIRKKIHSIYFEEYFEHLETRTILVENEYIDRDYLEDFSSYYVRCFSEYKRSCTRLHFFENEFCYDDFDALLNKSNTSLKESLQKNYLGFIVVKPLPQTIIGRTCLIPYPEEGDKKRDYPIVREYKINLFGIPLVVRSLAFQEQDHVVAACATSALWSVFQGTGILFQHIILSPGEITKLATTQLPLESRAFPNRGLSGEQMAHAIQSVNLEPLQIGINNEEYNIKSSIYAYLRYGIPIILGVKLYDTSSTNPQYIGRHAAAVTGYRIESEQSTICKNKNLQLVSSKTNKIYVHDDQVGPFSRLVFDGRKIKLDRNGSVMDFVSLATSWKINDIEMGDIRAVPEMLLVPLYHKIRIPFETIHETIKYFNTIIEKVNEKVPISKEKIEWDIYLSDINRLKSEIFAAGQYADNYFKNILLMRMPKFIWRATALIGNIPMIDFLFDATDIEQGEYFVCAIEYDRELSSILREIFREDIFEETLKNTNAWKIIQWFRGDKKHETW